MKKKIGSAILGVAVLVFAFLYAHVDRNDYLYDRTADSSEFVGLGALYGEEEITQTFTAEEDTLDGVNVKATVVGNVEDAMLEYDIIDTETSETVSGSLKGSEIQNNKFNKLKVKQIQNAKGREYTLVLREKGTDALNGICFYMDPSENQEDFLKLSGEKTEGVLVARTFSHGFDLETFVVLLGFIALVSGFMMVLYKLFK